MKDKGIPCQIKSVIVLLVVVVATAVITFAFVFPYIEKLYVNKYKEEMSNNIKSTGKMLDYMVENMMMAEDELWEFLCKICDEETYPKLSFVNIESGHKIKPVSSSSYPDMDESYFQEEGYTEYYNSAYYLVKGGKIGIYTAVPYNMESDFDIPKKLFTLFLVVTAVIGSIASFLLCRENE